MEATGLRKLMKDHDLEKMNLCGNSKFYVAEYLRRDSSELCCFL